MIYKRDNIWNAVCYAIGGVASILFFNWLIVRYWLGGPGWAVYLAALVQSSGSHFMEDIKAKFADE